jgi:hypothetical protein
VLPKLQGKTGSVGHSGESSPQSPDSTRQRTHATKTDLVSSLEPIVGNASQTQLGYQSSVYEPSHSKAQVHKAQFDFFPKLDFPKVGLPPWNFGSSIWKVPENKPAPLSSKNSSADVNSEKQDNKRFNNYRTPMDPPPILTGDDPLEVWPPVGNRTRNRKKDLVGIDQYKTTRLLHQKKRPPFEGHGVEFRNGLLYDQTTNQPIDTSKMSAKDPGAGRTNFVMLQNGWFNYDYTGTGKKHDQLSIGAKVASDAKKVAGAGWLATDPLRPGVMIEYSSSSGAYKPSGEIIVQPLIQMEKKGVDLTKVRVKDWRGADLGLASDVLKAWKNKK